MSTKHIGGHHHHMRISYAQSLLQRLYSFVLVPLLALGITVICIQTFANHGASPDIPLPTIVAALGASLLRLLFSYGVALVVALPLALFVTHNTTAERIFLPVFDIIQSLPVLAFFPVIIVFFVHYGLYNGAALFVLFITMLWSIVFSLVGGLHAIPSDIKAAGTIFGLRGFTYVKKILIPASIPYLITGSLLAFAGGWNIIIVAEVLHTYLPAQTSLPGSAASADLFGIGSILVSAAAAGQQQTFLLAIMVLIAAIAFLNLFVWQKLLKYAERYKFE